MPTARSARALVTGAAGGLGREIALQLAARGCPVGIVDINAAGAAETGGALGAPAATALVVACDLTREGAPEAAVAEVVDAGAASTSSSTMPATARSSRSST